jgi:hypothetical protein
MIDKRKWEIVETETKAQRNKNEQKQRGGGPKRSRLQQALQFEGR